MKYLGKFKYYTNWMLIETDPEITRYYRKLFELSKYKTDKLSAPLNKAHISVISVYNEKPLEYFDKKYDGEAVEFELLTEEVFDDGLYVWFRVDCPVAQAVRDELGMGPPHWPFHLTIGNRKPSA